MLVSSALASMLVVSNYSRSLVQVFTFSILLSTAATLLPCVISSAAWLWRGAGGESLLWGPVLVAAGLPVYWLLRRG